MEYRYIPDTSGVILHSLLVLKLFLTATNRGRSHFPCLFYAIVFAELDLA